MINQLTAFNTRQQHPQRPLTRKQNSPQCSNTIQKQEQKHNSTDINFSGFLPKLNIKKLKLNKDKAAKIAQIPKGDPLKSFFLKVKSKRVNFDEFKQEVSKEAINSDADYKDNVEILKESIKTSISDFHDNNYLSRKNENHNKTITDKYLQGEQYINIKKNSSYSYSITPKNQPTIDIAKLLFKEYAESCSECVEKEGLKDAIDTSNKLFELKTKKETEIAPTVVEKLNNKYLGIDPSVQKNKEKRIAALFDSVGIPEVQQEEILEKIKTAKAQKNIPNPTYGKVISVLSLDKDYLGKLQTKMEPDSYGLLTTEEFMTSLTNNLS